MRGAVCAVRRAAEAALVVVACVFVALGSVPDASAESAEGWQFQFSPYLWLPSVDMTVGTPARPALPTFSGSADSFDLLEALDFGFLGLAEVRHGRYGALADFMYLGLTIDKDAPFAGFAGAEAETDAFVGTTALTYRIVDGSTVTVDALAGARVYAVSVDLTFEAGAAMRRTASVDEVWVDPIFGGRVRADLGGGFFGVLYGDVGGFGAGSEFTSQAYAGVGYDFSESTSAQVGYRYLGFEYEYNGGVPLDMDMYGPLIGGTFRF